MPPTTNAGLRRVHSRLNPEPAPDGQLLARFLEHRDEAAFAEVVHRHAAMVLGTCRRLLGNAADADDAFQAVFIVLVRRGYGLTGRVSIGNFLYGVAFHTALKAKAMAAKRRIRESRSRPPEPSPDRSDLLAALDEELAKLPDKYREPVVLCELEGRSRREASEALGIAEGTISSRLATAHRMLEKGLRSRGFAVLVPSLLAAQSVRASDSLAEAAVQAVACPSPAVSKLASEVTKMMFLHKFGFGAAALAMVLGVTAVAVGAVLTTPSGAEPPKSALPGLKPLAYTAAAAAAPAPEPRWKTDFRKVYGLREGELVRRVAPPYPECRAEYCKDTIRERYRRKDRDAPKEELDRDYSTEFTRFIWKDGWVFGGLMDYSWGYDAKPAEGFPLSLVLHATTGFQPTRFHADSELLKTKVTGDWVVKVGAEPEKVAAALETILRQDCGLKLTVAVKDIEREVYFVSGKYSAKPLPGHEENEIEAYASEVFDSANRGGGGGTFEEMAGHIERWMNYPIVLGTIEGAPKSVHWKLNNRIPWTPQPEESDPKAVMKNFAEQTGLTVKKEKREIKVLVVQAQ